MRYLFRRVGDRAYPTDEAGLKFWKRLKEGDLFWADGGTQRSLRHHRLYWATCNFCAEHSDYTAKQVHTIFKARTGRFDLLKLADGQILHNYHSIAFAKMDEEQFSAFHDDVIRVICTDILPGVQRADVRRELMELIR